MYLIDSKFLVQKLEALTLAMSSLANIHVVVEEIACLHELLDILRARCALSGEAPTTF